MARAERPISPKEKVARIIAAAGLSPDRTYVFTGQGKYTFRKGRRYRFSAIVAAVLITKGWIQLGD